MCGSLPFLAVQARTRLLDFLDDEGHRARAQVLAVRPVQRQGDLLVVPRPRVALGVTLEETRLRQGRLRLQEGAGVLDLLQSLEQTPSRLTHRGLLPPGAVLSNTIA